MPASTPQDFDFLIGHWKVSHRRLKERLLGCEDWERFEGRCRMPKPDAAVMPSPGAPARSQPDARSIPMTRAPAAARAAAVAAPSPEAAPVTIADEPVICMVDRLCLPDAASCFTLASVAEMRMVYVQRSGSSRRSSG